ncbi:RRM domain-containing and KH domain-containing protein [Cryptosporidium canis]|uniref:RRM domain-containing and KH domain-containing protein n=1 Tax=Cryptosporidium canis TaxID=195482 RepID=A0ABQ8P7E9_9CRYT|nr:RRM domain-containing and KH domain-containing protein [Cryptosporidium canis]KAJ1611054.1 RRM domain-containing and KH domain-containing protein [Cryptosporidium canis]
MLKKQQSTSFGSLQEAFKPLEYDSLSKSDVFEPGWQSKGEHKLGVGESMGVDHSRLYSSQLIGGDLESISLNGFDIKFEKEMAILKDSLVPGERGYHEVPKFLMSYSDSYQSQAPQYEGGDEFQSSKFGNTLLTTQSSSCWSSNLFEQSYLEGSTDRMCLLRDESIFLEEDDGILDVLSHALSRSCLEDEAAEQISVGSESCKYSFPAAISSSPASVSCQQQILSDSGAGGASGPPGSGLSLAPYVLGLRVFRLASSSKRQISSLQLNTYDVMSLCSQFGNIIEISVSSEGNYVTYEHRESLERALSSLQNLQISSEGDFIHAYIHQTSSTMIGGLERTMSIVHNKWSHDFSPPSIKEICSPTGLVDGIGAFASTNTAVSASCRSNAAASVSGASTTTNTSSNSPWNCFDNSVTAYERNLWTAWLQDSKSSPNASVLPSMEGCDNAGILIHEEGEVPNRHAEQECCTSQQGASGELQIAAKGKNSRGFSSSAIHNHATLPGQKVANMTYSSIVGANLNKGHLKEVIHHAGPGGNEHSMSATHNSVAGKPCIQDSNAFKLKIIGKLDQAHPSQVDGSKGAGGDASSAAPSQSPAPSAAPACQSSPNILKKYTARYEIQIPPDNQFQIARRIIGTRGINMKRIFKLTQSKLRLRGKGSGYLEGYNKQEADEPLHLCISSTNSEQYINARKLVERLLLKIYQEYDDFLLSNNNNHKTLNLQLKFKETMRTKQLSSPTPPQMESSAHPEPGVDELSF